MPQDHKVIAQVPGVFYRRPSPEADEYVKEGDSVSEGDTIGLVELMKSYHEVNADASGTLKEFLIDNEGEVQPGDEVAVISS